MHGHRNSPIPPTLYGTVLPGAIAIITFTLSHRLIRRPKNSSHFTATINEIEVLERPTKISLTPSKIANKQMFKKRKHDDQRGPITRSKRIRGA
jgi:hypothetical protein